MSQNTARVVESCAGWVDSGMQKDQKLFLSLSELGRVTFTAEMVFRMHISSTALLQCSYCQYPYYHTDLPNALEKSHSTNTTLYNVRMITSKAFVKSSNLIMFAGLPSLPVCVYQKYAYTMNLTSQQPYPKHAVGQNGSTGE